MIILKKEFKLNNIISLYAIDKESFLELEGASVKQDDIDVIYPHQAVTNIKFKSIFAFGSVKDMHSNSFKEFYKQVIDSRDYVRKRSGDYYKKSYKCFASRNWRDRGINELILHESSVSSLNCLISVMNDKFDYIIVLNSR